MTKKMTKKAEQTQILKELISKFFAAKKAGAKNKTLIKHFENIKLKMSIFQNEINGGFDLQDKWIKKFYHGEVVKGDYNKKLWVKLG